MAPYLFLRNPLSFGSPARWAKLKHERRAGRLVYPDLQQLGDLGRLGAITLADWWVSSNIAIDAAPERAPIFRE